MCLMCIATVGLYKRTVKQQLTVVFFNNWRILLQIVSEILNTFNPQAQNRDKHEPFCGLFCVCTYDLVTKGIGTLTCTVGSVGAQEKSSAPGSLRWLIQPWWWLLMKRCWKQTGVQGNVYVTWQHNGVQW